MGTLIRVFDNLICSGGQMIFGYYSGSPSRALQEVYPEFRWDVFRFKVLPKLSWKDEKVLFAFVKAIEEVIRGYYRILTLQNLHITSHSDWYRVSEDQIELTGSMQYFERNGGLYMVRCACLFFVEFLGFEAILSDVSLGGSQVCLKRQEVIAAWPIACLACALARRTRI